ncbi:MULTISPECIES: RICIN domain-containing protein [unclassified Micromonospora]|uniref:RICIN domain-containing protein n=1 Tax=unclassified Micromonospora TaxID=2617518 RepID=UPI0036296B0E
MSKHRLIAGAVAGAAALVLAIGGAAVAAGAGPLAYAQDVAPLAATAGCGQAPALTSGTRTISSSGENRSFILRIPDNYDRNRPYRLIFAFHWNGGTANDVDSGGTSGYPWSYYGIRALSNNSAIFVAPQGIGNGWANSGGRDLTFVDDMMRQIEAGLCVDTTQRFAMGFSYGGGMSYAIACARATVFRAVAVYAGAELSGCSGGTQPIAYIGIHGLRDSVIPISTGRSLRDRFVRNNGCTPQNPPEPAQGSLTHTLTYYSGCQAGYPVAWAPFDGPHAPNAVDGSADPFAPGENSWTRPVVWSFFTQFDGTTPPTPTPTPTSSPAQGVQVVGGQSGRCVDVPNASTTNGTQTQLWDCTGGTAQRWTHTAARQLQAYGTKCLDASGAGTSNGTQVIIWDCHGGANQQWNVNANGTITNAQSGLCLDATNAATANGTKLILWSCNGGQNQQWSLR